MKWFYGNLDGLPMEASLVSVIFYNEQVAQEFQGLTLQCYSLRDCKI